MLAGQGRRVGGESLSGDSMGASGAGVKSDVGVENLGAGGEVS